MTAQLLEYTSPSDKVVRRVRSARAAAAGAPIAPHRDRDMADARAHAAARFQAAWGATAPQACEVTRPVTTRAASPAASPTRGAGPTHLVWTARGVAVMVTLVVLVVGVMLATAAGAFLAVSNEPLVALVGA